MPAPEMTRSSRGNWNSIWCSPPAPVKPPCWRDHNVAGLLGCWVAGLLGCWVPQLPDTPAHLVTSYQLPQSPSYLVTQLPSYPAT